MQQRASDPFDLDGRVFDLISSTASRVDPESPTRFAYHESDGLVWGEYAGDTVLLGRFVGVRAGDRLTVSFVHAPVDGSAVVGGAATSRIERGDGERLRLVEDFETDRGPQASICEEVSATP